MIVSVKLMRTIVRSTWIDVEVDNDLVDWKPEAIDKALKKVSELGAAGMLLLEEGLITPWEVCHVLDTTDERR